MVWKCPLCKKIITCASPYMMNYKVIECCISCANKHNLKMAIEKIWFTRSGGIKIPHWKADIPVIVENE